MGIAVALIVLMTITAILSMVWVIESVIACKS